MPSIIFRIEELTEALDEREKIKQVVKEKEEKLETLNKSFDEKDKMFQELESRCVLFRLHLNCIWAALGWHLNQHLNCIQILFRLFLDCIQLTLLIRTAFRLHLDCL